MTFKPISLDELNDLLAHELADCPQEICDFYARNSIAPSKWQQMPWGESGGGFWAIAIYEGRVLWYNDIEEGFNVSNFERMGEIPSTEYWCNQDALQFALRDLAGFK
jgi:hypothetical protein